MDYILDDRKDFGMMQPEDLYWIKKKGKKKERKRDRQRVRCPRSKGDAFDSIIAREVCSIQYSEELISLIYFYAMVLLLSA